MRAAGVAVVLLAMIGLSGCEVTIGDPQGGANDQSGDAGDGAQQPAPEPAPEPKPPKPEPTGPPPLGTGKIANQFSKLIAEEVQGSVTVKCPKSVPLRVGSTFKCKVSGDATGPITVTIEDKKGNVDADFSQVSAG